LSLLCFDGHPRCGGQYAFPFGSLAPGGPEGISPESDVDSMVTVIRSIRETATVASQAS